MNAVATLTLPDLHATVSADGDTFVLWWTDYVANEWTETHPDLGTALARPPCCTTASRTGRASTSSPATSYPSLPRS
ncbi:hypothetical protein [Williamsia sp. DF01-3]|uniref:hypothetical protein n=1 Tax=Williamsia sp. DF01-3 TaxID=2934157 RepID=UPI001FF4D6D0|nr:hypothetical protein [Williamsia sp. DF01-3]MCK0515955.1 hypothetical protein [Williamsia sp. DF01-3]